MEVPIMKLSKSILITLLFMITSIVLTACQNDTSYVNDQTGKEISVTTSDDTYTFKLPAAEVIEVTAPVAEEIPTEIEAPVSDNSTEEPLASEGPKTGEP